MVKKVVKKTFRRKKHHHKKNPYALISLKCPFRRGSQLYPDRYLCTGHTHWSVDIANLGAVGTQAYNFFSFAGNTVCNNNGPAQAVNHGAFGGSANNVPSGLGWLLGDDDAAGASVGGNAPYYNYRVHKSTVTCRFLPYSVATQANVQMTLFPFNLNVSGVNSWDQMPMQTIAEQPYAKSIYIPYQMSTAPKKLSNTIKTLTFTGDRYKASMESGDFDGAYNVNPAKMWYWGIALGTIVANASDYSIYGSIEVDIYSDIEFLSRNTYSSNNAV